MFPIGQVLLYALMHAVNCAEQHPLKICISSDSTFNEQSVISIRARMFYINYESGMSVVFSVWIHIKTLIIIKKGPSMTQWSVLTFEATDICKDFSNFQDIVTITKEWCYLDLYSCSSDTLAIDSITYDMYNPYVSDSNVVTVPINSFPNYPATQSNECIVDGKYFRIGGTDCNRIVVSLSTTGAPPLAMGQIISEGSFDTALTLQDGWDYIISSDICSSSSYSVANKQLSLSTYNGNNIFYYVFLLIFGTIFFCIGFFMRSSCMMSQSNYKQYV